MELFQVHHREVDFDFFSNDVWEVVRNWDTVNYRWSIGLGDKEAVGNVAIWSSVGSGVVDKDLSKEFIATDSNAEMFSGALNQQLNNIFL